MLKLSKLTIKEMEKFQKSYGQLEMTEKTDKDGCKTFEVEISQEGERNVVFVKKLEVSDAGSGRASTPVTDDEREGSDIDDGFGFYGVQAL